jgi:protein TonB
MIFSVGKVRDILTEFQCFPLHFIAFRALLSQFYLSIAGLKSTRLRQKNASIERVGLGKKLFCLYDVIFVNRQVRFMSILDTKRYSLRWAIGLSFAVHAALLAIKFAAPAQPVWTPPNPMIVAVLVNVQSKNAPKKAAAIAQVNLDGGGELEQRGLMPSSPLEKGPTSLKVGVKQSDGEKEKEVEALELQVAKLMAQTQQKSWKVEQSQPDQRRKQEASDSEKMAIDLAARIDKQALAYASRPKKAFVGLQATQSDLAVWVEGWQRKVESMGNAFYPEQARGRVRGTLILTAVIRSDGRIDSIQIEQSSGHKLLDESAQRIMRLSAPFEPFDSVMSRKIDLIYITRQWRFGPEGLERLESTPGH